MSTNAPLSRIKRSWATRPAGGNRYLWGREARIPLSDFASGTSLGGHIGELEGRSVLLAVRDQIAAALALTELDGVAGRIVLCTPDIALEQISSIIQTAAVNAIVYDDGIPEIGCAGNIPRFLCSSSITPAEFDADNQLATEWVLLSSGTSRGVPKLVVHTLATLTAPMRESRSAGPDVVWGTFYDIRRYGGLQIFLRTITGGGSMVLSCSGEPVAEHLGRLHERGVTHLTGTPSHWRRVLMSGHADVVTPRYVRLSGEIADQAVLDMLKSTYSKSLVAHAFASTEAGVVMEVDDGLAGFPAEFVGRRGAVEIAIADGSLQIRSDRTAIRYLGDENGAIADASGLVDTGDMVERRGDRYYFLGRRNGIINIGGLKVHPEEIEAVINAHPRVAASVVRPRKNPVLGAVVVAEVMLKPELTSANISGEAIEDEILTLCRERLPPHKVPATLRLVPSLGIAEAGKIMRHNA